MQFFYIHEYYAQKILHGLVNWWFVYVSEDNDCQMEDFFDSTTYHQWREFFKFLNLNLIKNHLKNLNDSKPFIWDLCLEKKDKESRWDVWSH